MAGKGIMTDIRRQLAEGKSAQQLIAEGYSSGSVYKAQWQMKRNDGHGSQAMATEPSVSATSELSRPPQEHHQQDIFEFNDDMSQEMFAEVQEELEDPEYLWFQLQMAEAKIEDLKEETGQVPILKQRIDELESEAQAIPQLRQRIHELEAQLQRVQHTEVVMRQGVAQRRRKHKAEQAARQDAEGQAEEYHQHVQKLWQDNTELKAQMAAMEQVVRKLCQQLQGLMPLQVWAGHPCTECNKPMSGVVDRATAARLLKEVGHKACLEKKGDGTGMLLLAGGAAAPYGLLRRH